MRIENCGEELADSLKWMDDSFVTFGYETLDWICSPSQLISSSDSNESSPRSSSSVSPPTNFTMRMHNFSESSTDSLNWIEDTYVPGGYDQYLPFEFDPYSPGVFEKDITNVYDRNVSGGYQKKASSGCQKKVSSGFDREIISSFHSPVSNGYNKQLVNVYNAHAPVAADKNVPTGYDTNVPCEYESLDSVSSTSSAVTSSDSGSESPKSSTTSTTSSPPAMLPPCRVCGEKASGFHYGVNTCEACKGFFRRSLQRNDKYRCTGSGRCVIGPGRRNACPSCRYKKCLAVGMSKSAIKTGRYTHEKRTQDILEVKKLRVFTIPKTTELIPAVPRPIGNNVELSGLINIIIDAHNRFVWSTSYVADDVLREKQKAYYDQYMTKLEMFGDMRPLSSDEYNEIYHTTGIDVDNRQNMLQSFAQNMELGVRRYINFAKLIPGFSELSINDQSNLIKSSRFEFWFLGNFRGYNKELDVVTFPSGNTLHKQEMWRVWEKGYVNAIFDFAESLKKLNLSPDEYVLIKSICVLFSDRCDLSNPEKVEDMQWKVIQCLMYMLYTNHPSEPGLFARIMDRLTALRELTDWNQKLFCKIKVLPTFQKSPLLIEILTS